MQDRLRGESVTSTRWSVQERWEGCPDRLVQVYERDDAIARLVPAKQSDAWRVMELPDYHHRVHIGARVVSTARDETKCRGQNSMPRVAAGAPALEEHEFIVQSEPLGAAPVRTTRSHVSRLAVAGAKVPGNTATSLR